MFDESRKYRIVSGESIDYADTLGAAKLLAGEWLAERERRVEIVRQHGRPTRWSASLASDGAVKLVDVFADAQDVPASAFETGKAAALAKLIDREAGRRVTERSQRDAERETARRARSMKFGKGVARAVICLSTKPPRWFDHLIDAAAWVGVTHQSMGHALKPGRKGRRRTCCRMAFEYADRCPPEIVAAAKAAEGMTT